MKKCLLLLFLCVLPLCLLNGWLRGFLARNLSTSTFTSTSNSTSYSSSNFHCNRNQTILLWHWPFGSSSNLSGDVCWNIYGIPRCRLVNQRSLYASADVVVFHNRELIQGRQKLPFHLPRPRGQRWAWMSLESPVNNGNLRSYAGVFNLTMSYRRDADVSIPYGKRLPNEDKGGVLDDVPLNKSSLVCWVVSNYQSSHRRSKVYKELNAIVPVKVYGRWSRTPLSSKDLLPAISRCYFYLAFENSVSKDYITEKLWRNAYQAGAVPVVLGPPLQDYKAVAPPSSFIHVDEFASLKDLGERLQQIAADRKLYSEYFKWKQEWKVHMETDWRWRLCEVCNQCTRLPQNKVYSDLAAWVNADT